MRPGCFIFPASGRPLKILVVTDEYTQECRHWYRGDSFPAATSLNYSRTCWRLAVFPVSFAATMVPSSSRDASISSFRRLKSVLLTSNQADYGKTGSSRISTVAFGTNALPMKRSQAYDPSKRLSSTGERLTTFVRLAASSMVAPLLISRNCVRFSFRSLLGHRTITLILLTQPVPS